MQREGGCPLSMADALPSAKISDHATHSYTYPCTNAHPHLPPSLPIPSLPLNSMQRYMSCHSIVEEKQGERG